jgi:hypothetical protein
VLSGRPVGFTYKLPSGGQGPQQALSAGGGGVVRLLV